MSTATQPEVPFHRPSLTRREHDAVIEVLESEWLTTGQRVLQFEESVRERLGCKHAVAVNSATAALHLALEALGVGPGDEVLVPTYTFAACGSVVVHLGAEPRLADVDRRTLMVTPETLERQVTSSTKALMVVHFGGLLADMEPIRAFAEERSIAIVEDAAHALPTRRAGRDAGTFGDAAALSFYATKTVTAGEGGMLVTDRQDLAERARVMRLHGISRDAWKRYTSSGTWFYEIEAAGYKYNMPDLAAALGLVQLDRADAMRMERQRVAERYRSAFAQAELAGLVELPVWPHEDETHAWHLFPIRLHLGEVPLSRDEVIQAMQGHGVMTSVHFIPLHLHPYYARTFGYRREDLAVAAEEYEREISLPIYPDLTNEQVDRVVDSLASVLRSL